MKKRVIYSIMSVVLTLIPLININAIKMTKSQKQFNIVQDKRTNIYKPKKNLNFHHDLSFIDTPEIKKSQTPLEKASNIYIKKQLHQNFQNLINDPKKVHSLKKLKTTPQLYISQNYLKNSNNKVLNIKIDNIKDTKNIEKNNIHFKKHLNEFLQDEFKEIHKREKIPNIPIRKILIDRLKPKCLVSNFNENPKNINNKNTYNDIYKEKMNNPQKNIYSHIYFKNKPITNLKTKNFDDYSLFEDEINYEENDSIMDSNTIIELLELLNSDKTKNIPNQTDTIKEHNTDFNKNPNKIKKSFENLNIKKHNKNNIEIYDKIMIQKKQNAKNMENLIYKKKIRKIRPTKYYKKSL